MRNLYNRSTPSFFRSCTRLSPSLRGAMLIIVALLGSLVQGFAQTTVTLNSSGDVEIWNNSTNDANKNYGACNIIYVNGATSSPKQRDLIQFNVSSIPSGASITSATLRLVKVGGGNTSRAIAVYRITSPWTEGTGDCNGNSTADATWNNRTTSTAWGTAGGDFNATAYATTNVAGNAAYTWTITSLVQEWVNATNPNYGLMVKYETENVTDEKNFASEENNTTADRPQLIVTYTLPTATLAANTVAAATLCPLAAKVPIQSFSIAQTVSNADFTGLNFTTIGTYVAGDLSNFKLWTNTTNTLGTATQISSTLTPAGPGTQTFAAFTQVLTTGQTRFFWITMDVATPTSQKTLAVNAITTTNITTSGGEAGSTTAGGTQTINAVSGTISSQTNVLCFGQSTGAFTVTGSGGTAPYTYSFNGGAYSATATFTGLIAGAKTVTVRDANLCTSSTINFTITQPASAVSGTISSQTNVLCFGLSTGAFTVTGSGGTSPYQYSLDGGAFSGTNAFTGRPAGAYAVTVRDANLCTSVVNVTITQPAAAVTGTITSQTNVLCRGLSTGAFTISGAGGTSPYQYSLNGGAFSSTNIFTGRPAGAYTVTVRDANLCTSSVVNITLTQPAAALAVTPTLTQPSCFAFGGITLSASGGTAPYTYDWADVSGTNNPQNRTGLSAGSYSVVVSDANGCSVSSGTITLNAPVGCAPLTVCSSGGPASVFSVDPDPSITTYTWTITPAGAIITGQGTNQISVNWSGVPGAGVYQVCVAAANTCGTTASVCQNVNVVLPPVPVVSATPACVGQSVQLLASGGTTYQWSGPGGFTSSVANPSLSNVTAGNNGTYSVLITNSAGCSATGTVSITVSTPPSLSAAVTLATACASTSGAVNLTVTPAGTYTYAWSNGATTEDISGLAQGNYRVVVTNAAGCTANATYSVNAIPGPIPTGTPANINCFGVNSGSITGVSTTGGTSPYTYAWTGSNGYTASTANITGLAAGTYNLIVTDNAGCTGAYTATITQASAININFSQTNVSCFGGTTGSISVTAGGGTGSYNYVWLRNGSPFGTNTPTLTALTAGTYQVTVTDGNSCTSVQTVTITQPASPLSATTTITNVSCFGGSNGQVVLTPAGGTAPYTFAWTGPSSFTATTKNISGRTAGTYSVTITDAKGCTLILGSVIIEQAFAPLTIGFLPPQNVSCFGGNDGFLGTLASGGTEPYAYNWSNGASTRNITGLSAGTYNLTVTDAFGCVATLSLVITQPASALSASATPVNTSCFGSTNGGVTLSVSGGTANYTYLWSNGTTSQNLTNVAAGNYQVTVTDARGCTAISTATVNSPVKIDLSGAVTNVLCNGASTGAITLSRTGGTAPFGYDWGGGITTQNRTGLAAGTYNVTVTDGNGCTDTKTYTITQNIAITATLVNSNISCSGGSNGSINLSVSGGTGPYTYVWSNGATTEDIMGLVAGVYSVTVTDANGCSAFFSSTAIADPVQVSATAAVNNNVSCYAGNNGGATITPAGGTAPFTYGWSDGGTGAIRTNLMAGSFTVTITDANGCSAQTPLTITQPDSLELFAEVTNNNGCGRPASGSIVLTAQAGTAPYTYAWTRTGGGFSATTKDISGLSAGTYTVTVTDDNGCSKQLTSIVGTEASTLAVTISKTDITCLGFPSNINGTATVAPTGGTLPYTYDWVGTPNGDGTAFITGLAAGSYSVTVTDAGGCTASTSVTINGTTCTPPVAVNDTLRSCNGNLLSGNVATNDNINGVPLNQMTFINLSVPLQAQGDLVWSNTFDGSYTFTPNPTFSGTVVIPYKVEDPFGLSATANLVIIVSRLDLSLAAAQVVNVTCSTLLGSITIPVPTSGTGPYEYSINGTTYQAGNVFSGLAAGTYTIYVRDANNCAANAQVILANTCPGITLRLKVLLQGSLLANTAPNRSIMRDNLRSSAIAGTYLGVRSIPNTDPYTDSANLNTRFIRVGPGTNSLYQTILNPTTMFANRSGTNQSAVDWIFIELRDKNNSATVLATRSAIVQQDGTVVDIDGNNCVFFPGLVSDNYYIAVRHRNHLGAMTATALTPALYGCSSGVDFTTMTDAEVWHNPATPQYDGLEMAKVDTVGGVFGKRALWAGNASSDFRVRYTGIGSDPGITQTQLQNYVGATSNTTRALNFLAGFGYFTGDVNMDSRVRYTGVGSDPGFVQTQIQNYLLNTTKLLNYILLVQQLP